MALRAIRPMLASSATELPEGSDWSYEVKWDGYRAIAIKDAASVQLSSRNVKDLTREYPTVAAGVRTLGHRSVMLDGEIELVGTAADYWRKWRRPPLSKWSAALRSRRRWATRLLRRPQ